MSQNWSSCFLFLQSSNLADEIFEFIINSILQNPPLRSFLFSKQSTKTSNLSNLDKCLFENATSAHSIRLMPDEHRNYGVAEIINVYGYFTTCNFVCTKCVYLEVITLGESCKCWQNAFTKFEQRTRQLSRYTMTK